MDHPDLPCSLLRPHARRHGFGAPWMARLAVCIAMLEVSQLIYLAAVSGAREDAQALIARLERTNLLGAPSTVAATTSVLVA